ncbi:MAG: FAD-dependent monooxygenase [Steroidobacteraceae bacterium]
MPVNAAPTQPLRVAIVGGGISGLAAANALVRRGMEVRLFEQAQTLREVGAGLITYPNSVRLLERMGLKDALAAVGALVGAGSRYCRKDGTTVGAILTADSQGWNGLWGLHRADLLNVLAAALPPNTVYTGHRCIDFSQDEQLATLSFENGTRFDADVVVAADGIKSVLQKCVVPPSLPEYSGVRAYRGLVPRDRLRSWRDGTHQVWMGDGKHFMVYPVRRGEWLNYVGFVPTSSATIESWSAIGDRDELARSFADWDPEITELLNEIETCFWWGLYDRKPLERWTAGRLVLLGDAAHPMLPHLGQGANQAIEDGVALAVLLDGNSSSTVPGVLREYEQFRRARTDVIWAEARKNGLRYDSRYESLEQRDKEIRNSAAFRKSLYDYDVEHAALALRSTNL